LSPRDPNVIGIAADHAVEDVGLPVFSLDDVAGIAAFVREAAGL
jgi:hypothetical protein